jgi:cytochrome c peroxidase
VAYASFSPDFHYDAARRSYAGGQFWDGRAKNVADQAKGPILNPLEMSEANMPKNPQNKFYTLGAKYNPAGKDFVDLGLGGQLKKRSENGKFKVPSLPNVALTAPYMNNGCFTVLKDVVRFYNTRDISTNIALR